jgi:hypothetical protein
MSSYLSQYINENKKQTQFSTNIEAIKLMAADELLPHLSDGESPIQIRLTGESRLPYQAALKAYMKLKPNKNASEKQIDKMKENFNRDFRKVFRHPRFPKLFLKNTRSGQQEPDHKLMKRILEDSGVLFEVLKNWVGKFPDMEIRFAFKDDVLRALTDAVTNRYREIYKKYEKKAKKPSQKPDPTSGTAAVGLTQGELAPDKQKQSQNTQTNQGKQDKKPTQKPTQKPKTSQKKTGARWARAGEITRRLFGGLGEGPTYEKNLLGNAGAYGSDALLTDPGAAWGDDYTYDSDDKKKYFQGWLSYVQDDLKAYFPAGSNTFSKAGKNVKKENLHRRLSELKINNYQLGSGDGLWGEETYKAVVAFQQDIKKLIDDGQIDDLELPDGKELSDFKVDGILGADTVRAAQYLDTKGMWKPGTKINLSSSDAGPQLPMVGLRMFGPANPDPKQAELEAKQSMPDQKRFRLLRKAMGEPNNLSKEAAEAFAFDVVNNNMKIEDALKKQKDKTLGESKAYAYLENLINKELDKILR